MGGPTILSTSPRSTPSACVARLDPRGHPTVLSVAEAELPLGVVSPTPDGVVAAEGTGVKGAAGTDLCPVDSGTDLGGDGPVSRVADSELAIVVGAPALDRSAREVGAGVVHAGGDRDRRAGATEHVRQTIDDPRVKIAAKPIRVEPSAVSDIEATSFQLIHRTLRQAIPEALVAPALLVAGTDSHYYAPLTKNIYRFLPITLRPDDASRYHGIDERISFQDYERCVRFYVQLIQNSQQ